MKTVFADTFFFVATILKTDLAHKRATAFAERYRGQIVTTSWVLTEVANTFARSPRRASATQLLCELPDNPSACVIPASRELFERGVELYASRPDKEWSLTDCISFIVMRDEKLTDALTGDHHFEQAGFNILLK